MGHRGKQHRPHRLLLKRVMFTGPDTEAPVSYETQLSFHILLVEQR